MYGVNSVWLGEEGSMEGESAEVLEKSEIAGILERMHRTVLVALTGYGQPDDKRRAPGSRLRRAPGEAP